MSSVPTDPASPPQPTPVDASSPSKAMELQPPALRHRPNGHSTASLRRNTQGKAAAAPSPPTSAETDTALILAAGSLHQLAVTAMTSPARSSRSDTEEIGRPEEAARRDPLAYTLIEVARNKVGSSELTLEDMLGRITNVETKHDGAVQLLQALAEAYQQYEDIMAQMSEYVRNTLEPNSRYQELCRVDPDIPKLMQAIMIRGQQSQKRRQLMWATLDSIRRYAGDDFFYAYIFDEMTPYLATTTWGFCKWCYNNHLPFPSVFLLLNRVRAARIMAPAAQGVSPTSRLMTADIDRTKKLIDDAYARGALHRLDDGTFGEDVRDLERDFDSHELCSRADKLVTAGSPSVTVDGDNLIHIGKCVPAVIHNKFDNKFPATTTTHDFVVLNKKGRAQNRNPDANFRPVLAVQSKPSSQSVQIPHVADTSPPPSKKTQSLADADVGPPPSKRARTSEIADTDSSPPTKKARTDEDPDRSPAPADTTAKEASLQPTEEGRWNVQPPSTPSPPPPNPHWGPQGSVFDYRLGDHNGGLTGGLVSPTEFTPAQFGLENAPALDGTDTPRLRLSSTLSTQLFTSPTPAESKLLEWAHSVFRRFEDPTVASLDWQDHMVTSNAQPMSQGEIHEALSHVDRAIVPQCGAGGQNAIWRQPGMPQHSMFGLFCMLHGLSAMNRLHDPPWVQHIRAQVNRLVDHFGSSSPPALLGRDSVGRDIVLHPGFLTMDNLVSGHGHRGWLGTGLVFGAIRYLLRQYRDIQVLEPDDYVDWAQNRVSNPPAFAPVAEVPVVMLPYNLDRAHWSLLVLDFRDQTYEWLDSVEAILPPRKLRRPLFFALSNGRDRGDGWSRGTLRSQRQSNASDCGLWAIANAVAYGTRREAAGPQSTSGIRTWLTNVLAEALLRTPGTGGRLDAEAPQWVTEDLRPAVLPPPDREHDLPDVEKVTKGVSERRAPGVGGRRRLQDIERGIEPDDKQNGGQDVQQDKERNNVREANSKTDAPLDELPKSGALVALPHVDHGQRSPPDSNADTKADDKDSPSLANDEATQRRSTRPRKIPPREMPRPQTRPKVQTPSKSDLQSADKSRLRQPFEVPGSPEIQDRLGATSEVAPVSIERTNTSGETLEGRKTRSSRG